MVSPSNFSIREKLVAFATVVGAVFAFMQFLVLRNQVSLQDQQNQLVRIQTQNAALNLIADVSDDLERDPRSIDRARLTLSLIGDFSFDYFLGMTALGKNESKVYALLLSDGFKRQNAEQRVKAVSTLADRALSNFLEFDDKRPKCDYSDGYCYNNVGGSYYWWQSDLEHPWESKDDRDRVQITYQSHFRDFWAFADALLAYQIKLGAAGVEARAATFSIKQEQQVRDSLFPLFAKLVQFEKRRAEQLALYETLNKHPDPRLEEVEFFRQAEVFPYVGALVHAYMVWCGFSNFDEQAISSVTKAIDHLQAEEVEYSPWSDNSSGAQKVCPKFKLVPLTLP